MTTVGIISDVLRYREHRQHAGQRRMPAILKGTGGFADGLVIVLSLFIGVKHLWLDYLFTLSIVLLAYVVYLVIDDLDHPFRPGMWHVTARRYEHLLVQLQQNKSHCGMAWLVSEARTLLIRAILTRHATLLQHQYPFRRLTRLFRAIHSRKSDPVPCIESMDGIMTLASSLHTKHSHTSRHTPRSGINSLHNNYDATAWQRSVWKRLGKPTTPLGRAIMKRRSAAQNHTKEFIVDPDKPVDTSANGTRHLIAMKAYELYEQRGRENGYALEDWLEAESIVNGEAERHVHSSVSDHALLPPPSGRERDIDGSNPFTNRKEAV